MEMGAGLPVTTAGEGAGAGAGALAAVLLPAVNGRACEEELGPPVVEYGAFPVKDMGPRAAEEGAGADAFTGKLLPVDVCAGAGLGAAATTGAGAGAGTGAGAGAGGLVALAGAGAEAPEARAPHPNRAPDDFGAPASAAPGKQSARVDDVQAKPHQVCKADCTYQGVTYRAERA